MITLGVTMGPIKSILMHMDDSPACATRLRFTNLLAEQYDALATAQYSVLPAFMQYALAFSAGAELAPLMQEYETQRRLRTRALFDSTAGTGTARLMPRIEWAERVGEPVWQFSSDALVADLLVLGQHDPDRHGLIDAPPSGVPPDFATAVMFASGKPALLLPRIYEPAPIGRVVLVAWKPTRESARALAAALPFLQRAECVHLATWADADSRDGLASPDVESSLRRHGVNVIVHHDAAPAREVGELLLSRAADTGADLLVMGCYGHNRAREWALGGASRTILDSMTLPVLMSH